MKPLTSYNFSLMRKYQTNARSKNRHENIVSWSLNQRNKMQLKHCIPLTIALNSCATTLGYIPLIPSQYPSMVSKATKYGTNMEQRCVYRYIKLIPKSHHLNNNRYHRVWCYLQREDIYNHISLGRRYRYVRNP